MSPAVEIQVDGKKVMTVSPGQGEVLTEDADEIGIVLKEAGIEKVYIDPEGANGGRRVDVITRGWLKKAERMESPIQAGEILSPGENLELSTEGHERTVRLEHQPESEKDKEPDSGDLPF